MILAFGHQQRVGKTTACEYLVKNYGFKRLSFAMALYEECSNMFISIRKGEGVYPPEVYYHDELGITQWDYDGMTDKDPLLLQWWGTNVRRKQNPNYWVIRLAEKIDALGQYANVCIDDVRFTNEAEFLTGRGGHVIKIRRPDRPIDRDPNHQSEIDLIDYPWRHIIDNDSTIENLYHRLDGLMTTLRI